MGENIEGRLINDNDDSNYYSNLVDTPQLSQTFSFENTRRAKMARAA